MPTKGFQCNNCKKFHETETKAEACEKSHGKLHFLNKKN